MSVTAVIIHFFVAVGMGWLKASAPLNMFFEFVMAVKSQFWMVSFPPLLNALAPWNMPSMDVTAIVSQVVMSWSKIMAPWNMPSMSVTAVIIHFFVAVGMGWLKASAPLNMFFEFVMAVKSQFWMVSFPPLLNAL